VSPVERRVLVVGAAGRDFHDFNVAFREDPSTRVVAFTAAQIPGIGGRTYPPSLAGPRYPEGIPILDEADLEAIVRRERVDLVLFAYSDVSHGHVMRVASRALAVGADFGLLGPNRTMLPSSKPVVSVCAVRTGSGKSQTTRKLARLLRDRGKRAVAIRHPMPYGQLERQRVQRFATLEDMAVHECTIEEREEYEHHVEAGVVVYAGVDYAAILAEAEKEADVILWDGGNNDLSLIRPDLEIVVVDPHRAGHELAYHPGAVNFLRGHVLVINKIDSAPPESLAALQATIEEHRPDATVILADSELEVDHPELLRGKRVLAVEDGPSCTHGGMRLGAATVAAQRAGAAEIVDPRPWLVGSLKDTFATYPDIGPLLPAMGYSAGQIADLREVIARAEVDVVAVGTPIDLGRLIDLPKPSVRVRYSLAERGHPTLADVVERFLAERA
jgi:predicted GTPase